MQKFSSGTPYFAVGVNNFSARTAIGSGFSQKTVTYAVLDTGTSITFMPGPLLQPLYQMLSIPYLSSAGSNISNNSIPINCTWADAGVNITIGLSDTSGNGLPLPIPLNNFISQQPSTCSLDLAPLPNNGDYMILGDNFLKSVYTVVDVDEMLMGFAPLVLDPGASEIQPIIKGQFIPGTGITA